MSSNRNSSILGSFDAFVNGAVVTLALAMIAIGYFSSISQIGVIV